MSHYKDMGRVTLSDPATGCFAITPADADLAEPAIKLYVKNAGSLSLTFIDGSTLEIDVPDNTTVDGIIKRVAASSTASGIYGLR